MCCMGVEPCVCGSGGEQPELCTFVVAEGEVEVPGGGRGQGEVEAVSAGRLVPVHRADGLDQLKQTDGQKSQFNLINVAFCSLLSLHPNTLAKG